MGNTYIVVQEVFKSQVNGFLVGSNGWGTKVLFYGYVPGEFVLLYLLRRHTLLGFAYCIAVAREGLVLFMLVGLNGKNVTRRLRRESPFCVIFAAYVDRAGYDQEVTRFFHLNGVVEWD